MSRNRNFIVEIWDFLRIRKAWWLAPIIVMLLLTGAVIVLSQSSSLSPFIYALI